MKRMLALMMLVAGCAESPERPFAYRAQRPSPREERPAMTRPSPEVLTLEEAFRLLEAHHPALAEARARVEAARGEEDQAGRLPNPELMGRVESAPFEGGTTDDAEYLVGVGQRLPVGGRLGAAADAAERRREARERDLEARRQELRGAVQAAFAAALYMGRVTTARVETVEISRREVALARARLEAGETVAEEVARAELAAYGDEAERILASSVQDRAYRALAGAVGKPGLIIAGLDGDLEQALEVPRLEKLLDRLGTDAWAAAGRAEVEAARKELARAEAERIPDIDIELFYRRIGETDTDAFDAGLGLSIPLFDGKSGAVRAARAEVERAAARAQTSRQEREVAVRSAHATLFWAVQRARQYREAIVPRSARILAAAEARHGEGDESLSELLPVRRRHLEIRLRYLETLRDALQAWSELRPFLSEKS